MPELTANFQMRNQQEITNENDSIVAESVIEKIKQIMSEKLPPNVKNGIKKVLKR